MRGGPDSFGEAIVNLRWIAAPAPSPESMDHCVAKPRNGKESVGLWCRYVGESA